MTFLILKKRKVSPLLEEDSPLYRRNATSLAAAKSLQSCPTLCDPIHQAPLSLGFSRQEHWSGLPFPSPTSLTDTH